MIAKTKILEDGDVLQDRGYCRYALQCVSSLTQCVYFLIYITRNVILNIISVETHCNASLQHPEHKMAFQNILKRHLEQKMPFQNILDTHPEHKMAFQKILKRHPEHKTAFQVKTHCNASLQHSEYKTAFQKILNVWAYRICHIETKKIHFLNIISLNF